MAIPTISLVEGGGGDVQLPNGMVEGMHRKHQNWHFFRLFIVICYVFFLIGYTQINKRWGGKGRGIRHEHSVNTQT